MEARDTFESLENELRDCLRGLGKVVRWQNQDGYHRSIERRVTPIAKRVLALWNRLASNRVKVIELDKSGEPKVAAKDATSDDVILELEKFGDLVQELKHFDLAERAPKTDDEKLSWQAAWSIDAQNVALSVCRYLKRYDDTIRQLKSATIPLVPTVTGSPIEPERVSWLLKKEATWDVNNVRFISYRSLTRKIASGDIGAYYDSRSHLTVGVIHKGTPAQRYLTREEVRRLMPDARMQSQRANGGRLRPSVT